MNRVILRTVGFTTLLVVVLALGALAGASHAAAPGMLFLNPTGQTSTPGAPAYKFHGLHDPNGTGKFYMGREIAQVMGAGAMAWLDRPERESEERPEQVIRALDLHDGEVVADLGAGSGYFTVRIAPKVGKHGKVLAVDIQDQMLAAVRRRAAALHLPNVVEVKGSEMDPHLPAHEVDLVLMVDVYHELSYPYEVMTKVVEALKPDGRVVFVEYRREDPQIPIKELHKMSLEQLDKEMKAVGLVRVSTVETLPWQHIVSYAKHDASTTVMGKVLNPVG